MSVTATLTSKGQVTLPIAVRQALALERGDVLAFTVQGDQVVVAKEPSFLSLAGSVPVPTDRRSADWADVLEHARQARGKS